MEVLTTASDVNSPPMGALIVSVGIGPPVVRWALWATCTNVWLAACLQFGCAAEATGPIELPMAHDEYVYMIRFSPDGQQLVTAAGDNVARVWSWTTQEPLLTLPHKAAVYAAEFSPSGEHLATGSGDGNVTLWKFPSGTQVAQQQEHADGEEKQHQRAAGESRQAPENRNGLHPLGRRRQDIDHDHGDQDRQQNRLADVEKPADHDRDRHKVGKIA